jgi:hypothetical protein
MATYEGRMRGEKLGLSHVVLRLDDDQRLRIFTGPVAVGSWPMTRVSAERTSIYRFSLDIDGEVFEFFPEDPLGFSEAIGAVIDLTPTSRFSLKEAIERSR